MSHPNPPSLAPGLDSLAQWRHELLRGWTDLAKLLRGNDLLTPASADTADGVRVRLMRDKLVLALVAEYARGKSELVNAIFFADAGRRVLPATPGRTTMCTVELGCDAPEAPSLSLLPIETRAESMPLAEWRMQPDAWTRIALDAANVGSLVDAAHEVTRVKRVRPKEAEAFGLWSMQEESHLGRIGDDGLVEVPAWRHAVIDFPHPLLQSGLVVLDTPGLNALGAEPELTLGLLPSAHAVLFVLAADTGVTRSDLAVWREHLGGRSGPCFVVLNKVDLLDDPLASPADIARRIERQCGNAAETLGMPSDRVFAVSARAGLVARIVGDAAAAERSGLPKLESALAGELLLRRQQVLADATAAGARHLTSQAVLRVRELRRHHAEQMLELRGLRGKNSGKVRQMLHRVEQEAAEFEHSAQRIAALQAVHVRMTRDAVKGLGESALREDVEEMRRGAGASWLRLGARRSFSRLCHALSERLAATEAVAGEIATMLQASYRQLNAEYGFALVVGPRPLLQDARDELHDIEDGYSRYRGLSHIVKMQSPNFVERFHRMLLGRVRSVLEQASGEVQMWSKAAAAQLETQLMERRRNFRRRRDALERIQDATDDLERRLAEVENADQALHALLLRVTAQADELCGTAARGPLSTRGEAPAEEGIGDAQASPAPEADAAVERPMDGRAKEEDRQEQEQEQEQEQPADIQEPGPEPAETKRDGEDAGVAGGAPEPSLPAPARRANGR